MELIQQIAAELPPASQAASTLTNSYMCYVIGTRSWELLREDENGRTDFFGLVESEWPRHQLCPFCRRIRIVN